MQNIYIVDILFLTFYSTLKKTNPDFKHKM